VCHDAAAAGALRAGTDPDRLAHALLAQYQGIILLAKLNDSGVSALAPALHDFIDGYVVDGSASAVSQRARAAQAPAAPVPDPDATPHPSPQE
jgi:hypothetical protein